MKDGRFVTDGLPVPSCLEKANTKHCSPFFSGLRLSWSAIPVGHVDIHYVLRPWPSILICEKGGRIGLADALTTL
jgi:hypothetical protein